MKKNEALKAIQDLKKNSSKRNFKQSFDMVFTLTKLDLKKQDNHIDFFQTLHFSRGKEIKICALVGPELMEQAKAECKTAILVDDFDRYAKDKKAVKKLAEEHDYFIAQANIMPKVAASFGRVLGPKGKMPNPKAGCVVPPNANIKALVNKLQKTIRVLVKTALMVQAVVGNEDMPEEEVADNMATLYEGVISHLPGGKSNLKHVLFKLSMGKPMKLE